MKRIYHPYWKWEDYHAGLYDLDNYYNEQQTESMTFTAKEILCNSEFFLKTALKVVTEWRYAAEVNLSNPSRNRQAWIGQASCCYVLQTPEYITKYAWRLMTPEQQAEANRIADIAIKTWEEKQLCQNNTSLLQF
jgi:hypothetical protein